MYIYIIKHVRIYSIYIYIYHIYIYTYYVFTSHEFMHLHRPIEHLRIAPSIFGRAILQLRLLEKRVHHTCERAAAVVLVRADNPSGEGLKSLMYHVHK